MKPILLAALAAVVAAPLHAVNFETSVDQGMTMARIAAADGEDMALAALYQRLFVLQDKRRETELRSDEADLAIDDIVLAYLKYDDRMTKELLKEIAVDPSHRDYPNITEREKLQILASVREKIRVQRLGELELKRIARDADEVKALIAENLAHRPKAPAKP
ncbi:MAG: hypothetical protein PHS14_02355 [Elusimicrobia bacterium]|nr:hypothetical protein [Elusimicrobiota bacterium]